MAELFVDAKKHLHRLEHRNLTDLVTQMLPPRINATKLAAILEGTSRPQGPCPGEPPAKDGARLAGVRFHLRREEQDQQGPERPLAARKEAEGLCGEALFAMEC